MRLVLDTAVLVAGTRSKRGASNRLLRGALVRSFELIASVPLFLEYEAVLTRPEHLRAAGITSGDAEQLLDALAVVARPVRFSFLWRPTLRDANDEMVLETAVNGGADAIVTFNRTDFAGSERFGVEILDPGQALQRLD